MNDRQFAWAEKEKLRIARIEEKKFSARRYGENLTAWNGENSSALSASCAKHTQANA